MLNALQNHVTTISVGGRPLCNLRFADDIDLLAGSETELQELTNRLVGAARDYGMEISADKSKILVNSPEGVTASIHLDGAPLEQVESFKYLGATLTENGSSTCEIKKNELLRQQLLLPV